MKKFLNFIIGKLFRIPKANLNNIYPPLKIEHIPLDVKTLCCEHYFERRFCEYALENWLKREIARELVDELIPYIHFETTEDIFTDSIRYKGVIKIVIDKESKNE